MNSNIFKRTQTDLIITEEDYITGFLYVLCYLINELKKLLEKENRFFGIVISYMNSIEEAYKKILPNIDEDSEIIYQKIFYLHKPTIIKEYRKLCRRHVTKADSMISVIKKILDILSEYQDHEYHKEIKTLNKVITKLYDNIKNSGKKSKMTYLVQSFKKFIELGQVGKKCLNKFSILEEDEKREKKPIEDSGVRIDDYSDAKIKEIEWTVK